MIEEKKSVSKFEEHSDYFSQLYRLGGWGSSDESSSGGGSSINNTVEYRKFIEKFLIDKKTPRPRGGDLGAAHH